MTLLNIVALVFGLVGIMLFYSLTTSLSTLSVKNVGLDQYRRMSADSQNFAQLRRARAREGRGRRERAFAPLIRTNLRIPSAKSVSLPSVSRPRTALYFSDSIPSVLFPPSPHPRLPGSSPRSPLPQLLLRQP